MPSTRVVITIQLEGMLTDAQALTGTPHPTDAEIAAAAGRLIHAPSLRPALPGVEPASSSASVDVRR